MSHFDSPQVRIPAGYIDAVNDVVIGGKPDFGTSTTVSKLAGQLGQGMWLDDSEISWKSATPGFGGHFRYVRLSAASSAGVRGQIVFWDTLVLAASPLYQVTTLETGSASGATLIAGIVLNPSWGAGNYSIIQDAGLTYVQMRAALTVAGVTGAPIFAAGAGAGADNGFADYVTTWTLATASYQMQKFLGTAAAAPANSSLTPVYLRLGNIRG
jgi:hypothetical protein